MKKSDAFHTNRPEQYLETGDKHSWGQIYEKYKKQIFVRCLRITGDGEDARELTNEAFVKAFERIDTYDPKHPLFPWLYRIATNLCIDFVRKKRRLQFQEFENGIQENISNDESTVGEREHLRKSIKEAIQKLKRPQRRCFCLCGWCGQWDE